MSIPRYLARVTEERDRLQRIVDGHELISMRYNTLRTALRQCAEALDAIIPCCLVQYTEQISNAMDALALPVVQELLAQKGGDAEMAKKKSGKKPGC